jgi:predicted dehydrogenase
MTIPAQMPLPRVPNSMAAPILRWGVMGTGWIAERFVEALQQHTRQQVVAVGSRTLDGAITFAKRFDLRAGHGSYQELVADAEVDVVYIATPHNVHYPCAVLALDAGKHVLVEKPLALNASEALRIAQLAERRGLFCMEGMWTFSLPRYDVVRQLLESGVLGELHTVIADHGERFPRSHRIMRHDLAGGPLLDLGSYPIALANAVLGMPERVHAIGSPAPSGVNGQTAIVLGHPAGGQSAIHTTLLSDTPTTATIAGTKATLTLPGPFFAPGDVVLTEVGGRRRIGYTEPAIGHRGLHYQAAEVARRIAAGERSSPRRPLQASIDTLAVMDEIRRQTGVTFAEELP